MTLTELPTTEVAAGPEPRTERRRWPWLVVVGAIVVTVVIALTAWAWNYQPMSGGSVVGVEGGPGTKVRTIENTYGTEFRIVHAETESTLRLTMAIDLAPDAPAGVTLHEVGSPVPLSGSRFVEFADTADISSHLLAPPGHGQEDDLADGPVHLEPGDTLVVSSELTLPRCDRYRGTDGWTTFDQVPVSFSAFGMRHDVDIPLGYTVSFGDTPTCPAN